MLKYGIPNGPEARAQQGRGLRPETRTRLRPGLRPEAPGRPAEAAGCARGLRAGRPRSRAAPGAPGPAEAGVSVPRLRAGRGRVRVRREDGSPGLKPASFAYHRADSVPEAIALLAELGDEAKILAGGLSLVPMMNFRLARPSALVDVTRVCLLYTSDAADE